MCFERENTNNEFILQGYQDIPKCLLLRMLCLLQTQKDKH